MYNIKNFFQTIQNIFQKRLKKTTNPILVFSEESRERILRHLESLPSGSCFLLDIRRDSKGIGKVLTGFDRIPTGYKSLNVDGIPVVFLNSSLEVLKYSGVDFQNGNLLIYPRVDLESTATPNPQIIRFLTNKKVLSENSQVMEGAWDRKTKFKKPLLVKNLFRNNSIESVFLTKNSVQIELKTGRKWEDEEEGIANVILDYLESLPQPIRLFSGIDN